MVASITMSAAASSRASSPGGESSPKPPHPVEDHHDHKHYHRHHHKHHKRSTKLSKEELWKDALDKSLDTGGVVQMSDLDSSSHTAYARVVVGANGNKPSTATAPVAEVVKSIVDEVWTRVAKEILERKAAVEKDSYLSAEQLLSLGAVWLVNETAYASGQGADAHRLSAQDATSVPDWENFSLRVHFLPERFHVASTVDWSKPCRGLLIDNQVNVRIGDAVPHVPVALGLPDALDGVIVYENQSIGLCLCTRRSAITQKTLSPSTSKR
jgi:hypothetical protein